MARAKRAAAPAEEVEVDEEPAFPTRSRLTGATLDSVDGQPIFADGMSRRRWLAATHDERMAAAKDAFLAGDDEEVRRLRRGGMPTLDHTDKAVAAAEAEALEAEASDAGEGDASGES